MSTYMVNIESRQEAEHFIMLDELNTVSGKEFDRNCPSVQIVDPSNGNSFIDNTSRESHPENVREHEEREKQLFSITLNVDTDN